MTNHIKDLEDELCWIINNIDDVEEVCARKKTIEKQLRLLLPHNDRKWMCKECKKLNTTDNLNLDFEYAAIDVNTIEIHQFVPCTNCGIMHNVGKI